MNNLDIKDSCNLDIKDSCPLGGDISDDCSGCIYSGDYHFVNGECVSRNDDS